MTLDVQHWMESVSGNGWRWFVKYLAGNDTLLTKSHQAGTYVPKHAAFGLFPSLKDARTDNPRVRVHCSIDSHGVDADLTMIWYNKAKDECRMTGWGGQRSPVLDPDATGSLCVFAFHRQSERSDADELRVWLCTGSDQEDAIQSRAGPVDPGIGVLYRAGSDDLHPVDVLRARERCALRPDEIPNEWRVTFPDTEVLAAFAVRKLGNLPGTSADDRLLKRRDCETTIFYAVENAVLLPRIREAFATVALFFEFANSVTNRRKARSGKSLELHTKRIFNEETLSYSHNEITEGGKRPDFIFPSIDAYRSSEFPARRLRMLAVKTTCKDRWRQILNEADRIPNKFLLTLQEGVSATQLAEMTVERVTLVVPLALQKKYPLEMRSKLLSLEEFIRVTRAECA